MSLQHIQKNFPGLLHTPAKYEKNPPYGCEAITKRKCGSRGVASPIYKQASLVGCLKKHTRGKIPGNLHCYNMTISHDCHLSQKEGSPTCVEVSSSFLLYSISRCLRLSITTPGWGGLLIPTFFSPTSTMMQSTVRTVYHSINVQIYTRVSPFKLSIKKQKFYGQSAPDYLNSLTVINI